MEISEQPTPVDERLNRLRVAMIAVGASPGSTAQSAVPQTSVRTRLAAQSISRPVREQMSKSFEARVLAVFDCACNLVTPDGDVATLVTPGIGDGPLNIVLDAEPGNFIALRPGLAATLHKTNLHIGKSRIILNDAKTWEPRPDWETLRNQRAAIVNCLPLLWDIARRQAPTESLVSFMSGEAPVGQAGILPYVFEATPGLQAGWNGDNAQLGSGAKQLAGLGNGLTPVGDDFLAGAMLWAWLAHPMPEAFCREMVKVAAPRTTTLSAAFLRSAAQGECSEAWHQLLAALIKTDDDLTPSVRQVLAHGATSGADTLAGFLYAATVMARQSPAQIDRVVA